MDANSLNTKSFPELNAEALSDNGGVMEIESLCVNCEENGTTKLLLTKIPHYKEVVLMSFRCEHCDYSNSEIQRAGKAQDLGITFKVSIQNTGDLHRQVVTSDDATVTVPEIKLEIPPQSQKGVVTTVEGILQRVKRGLNQDQVLRRIQAPDDAEKIDNYIQEINDLMGVKSTFHLIVSDPSGNSFVENPNAPHEDPQMIISHFRRTREQDHSLGIYTQDEIDNHLTPAEVHDGGGATTGNNSSPVNNVQQFDTSVGVEAAGKLSPTDKGELLQSLESEVLKFDTECHVCHKHAVTNMKVTKIPLFDEVIIMATLCDYCGHKSNEVKPGGGIESKGKRISLKVKNIVDMSRDVLKTETCHVEIPEVDFQMGGYLVGGKFTTVEGLLNDIYDQVASSQTNFLMGDSATPQGKERMQSFLTRFRGMINLEETFTLILDDPAGKCYVQNIFTPEDDPQLEVEVYTRSHDQDEDLGLLDMKTERYGSSDVEHVTTANTPSTTNSPTPAGKTSQMVTAWFDKYHNEQRCEAQIKESVIKISRLTDRPSVITYSPSHNHLSVPTLMDDHRRRSTTSFKSVYSESTGRMSSVLVPDSRRNSSSRQ